MQLPLVLPPDLQHRLNLNLFYDPYGNYGRPAMVAVPGLTEWDSFGSGNVRAVHYNSVRNEWVILIGATCYTCTTSWVETSRGTITGGDTTGPAWIESNDDGDTVVATNLSLYYLTAGNSWGAVSGGDLPTHNPGPLVYQDKMFILADLGVDIFTPSDVSEYSWVDFDPSYPTGKQDGILDLLSVGRILYVFGGDTIEAFYNSGDATAPFVRIQGSMQEIGTKGSKCQAVVLGEIYMLTNQYEVYIITGSGSRERISTPLVELTLRAYSAGSFWTYGVNQTGWFCINADTGSASITLVYDKKAAQVGMNPWFQWAPTTAATPVMMPILCSATYPATYIDVLGLNNNKLCSPSATVYANYSAATPFSTIWYPPPIREDRRRITHGMFEAEVIQGVGAPVYTLGYKDDARTTFTDLSAITLVNGEYDNPLRWYQLGSALERQYRLKCDTSVARAIFGGKLRSGIGAE